MKTYEVRVGRESFYFCSAATPAAIKEAVQWFRDNVPERTLGTDLELSIESWNTLVTWLNGLGQQEWSTLDEDDPEQEDAVYDFCFTEDDAADMIRWVIELRTGQPFRPLKTTLVYDLHFRYDSCWE